MCAGYAGVVPINTADAGTASVNTAGAGAAPVNAEYPGVTHISTAAQMKAPDATFPAKIPGVVRKIKPSSTDMDEWCSEQWHKYQLQLQCARDYTHLHTLMHGMTFAPYLIKKSLESFENNSAIPLLDEPPQAHDQDLLGLQYASLMTCQEKRTVLVYPTFLRGRQCGEMWGCDDSHKPRSYLSKEEACSSTIAAESLFPSCIIKMKDGLDVSANHMNDKAHARVASKMAKLIMRIDKGVKHATAICALKKRLYGTLQIILVSCFPLHISRIVLWAPWCGTWWWAIWKCCKCHLIL